MPCLTTWAHSCSAVVLPMRTMSSPKGVHKQSHGCSCQGCKATNHTLRNPPEPSRKLHPEPTPAHAGTLQNLPEVASGTYTSTHQKRRNPPEPSGTCLQNPHQHTPEPSGTFRNLPEPASRTYTSTHRNYTRQEASPHLFTHLASVCKANGARTKKCESHFFTASSYDVHRVKCHIHRRTKPEILQESHHLFFVVWLLCYNTSHWRTLHSRLPFSSKHPIFDKDQLPDEELAIGEHWTQTSYCGLGKKLDFKSSNYKVTIQQKSTVLFRQRIFIFVFVFNQTVGQTHLRALGALPPRATAQNSRHISLLDVHGFIVVDRRKVVPWQRQVCNYPKKQPLFLGPTTIILRILT